MCALYLIMAHLWSMSVTSPPRRRRRDEPRCDAMAYAWRLTPSTRRDDLTPRRHATRSSGSSSLDSRQQFSQLPEGPF